MKTNSHIDKIHLIDSQKLSSEFYFSSLLEAAYHAELLCDRDIERIQCECLSLLADKIERYNNGDSSSIQIEKAQELMASIFFTVGVWLKTYSNPDDAVASLLQKTVKDIYQNGRRQIDTMVASAKATHIRLLQQLITTKNQFYYDTLVNEMSKFFKQYYPDYAAHKTYIDADYPLSKPISHLSGIEFIKAYLEAAYYENQFCSFFAAENIHHLLNAYSTDYQELLINIYELVLATAIGCTVVGMDCSKLNVTELGATSLYQTFERRPKEKILEIITQAVDSLNQQFQFSQELMQYIQSTLPNIANNIETAAKENMLKRVFFVPEFSDDNC